MPYLQARGDGTLLLRLHVQPRASSNAVCGVHGEALKIRLTTPPVDGRANKAIIAFLAEVLGLEKQSLSIKSGQQSRSKQVLIKGHNEQKVRQRLQSLLAADR